MRLADPPAEIKDPAVLSYLRRLMSQMEQEIARVERRVLPTHTVATLPSAAGPPRWIYVANEAGGAMPAFNDGTNWRRMTDRAVVS